MTKIDCFRRMSSSVLTATVLACLLASCVSEDLPPSVPAQGAPTGGADGEAAVVESGAEPGAQTGNPTETPDTTELYRVRAGDVVSVRVFQEARLNGNPIVDTDGTINLPLIGRVFVIGKTKYEIEQTLAQQLADGYLKNPQVTVEIQPRQGTVSMLSIPVFGEVRKPGPVTLPPGRKSIGLMDLIAAAGGFTETAARTRIQVTRIGEDGKRRRIKVNFDRIVNGDQEDLQLTPGDIVRVPETFF